jgi:hypothetical protein
MPAVFVSFPRRFCLSFALILFTLPALAKDIPFQVIEWPSNGSPALRFTFDKLRQLEGGGRMHGYAVSVAVQNLSPRLIPGARFSLYLFDKNKVRVGEDFISVNNIGPGETVKLEFATSASGVPASLSIQAPTQKTRTISLTVNSVPQGAMLKLDQTELGPTPRVINVTAGQHLLSFSKEGFTDGVYPLEVSPEDVSGGSVSYQLGASAFDSIELRDGSVLSGDLVSISGMDVEIRVGGTIQHIDRNKIQRVMLVQRGTPVPNLPAATTTNP